MCEGKNQRHLGEKSYAERSEAGKFLNLNFEKASWSSEARQKKLVEKLNRCDNFVRVIASVSCATATDKCFDVSVKFCRQTLLKRRQ